MWKCVDSGLHDLARLRNPASCSADRECQANKLFEFIYLAAGDFRGGVDLAFAAFFLQLEDGVPSAGPEASEPDHVLGLDGHSL